MPTPAIAPPASPADVARSLKQAWRDGAPPNVAGTLRDHPELLRRRTLVLDLAFEAYSLQEEAGRTPDAESFCRDLPAFRSDVRAMIRDYRALVDHPEVFDRLEVRWPEPGAVFAGFTVVRELGRGAFARAYLAADPDTGDRPVVLKLSPTASGEARTLGPVRHPHVAEVYWARRVDGVSALGMRFVGAATLADAVGAAFDTPAGRPPTARTILAAIDAAGAGLPEPDPVPPLLRPRQSYADAVAAIAARLAAALAALHARGVTHGDLKPSNVVLGPGGHPYLIDFNLAGGVGESLHRYGGTLPYMAPERIRRLLGQTTDAGPADRSDVYSFGAVLHQALTGRLPVEPINRPDVTDVAADLLARQQSGTRRVGGVGVPRVLARLVGECLAADPARRPTAAALARRLDRFVGRRARRAAWALAAAVAIGGAVVAWLATRPATGPETRQAAVVPISAPAPADPVTADDFVARGFRFLAKGDWSGAFGDFSDASRLRPGGGTRALMGYSRTRAGKFDEAAVCYTDAIDKWGYRPAWVLNNRAHARIQIGLNDPKQLSAGLADAEAALAADPGLDAAHYNRARARYLTGLNRATWRLNDPDLLTAVETDLVPALAAHPDAPRLHMFMAEVFAAPDWADAARLNRAMDHLATAVALGRSPRTVGSGPVLRRLTEQGGNAARLAQAPVTRQPDPADPGVAHPPAR